MKYEQPFSIANYQIQPLEYAIQLADGEKQSLQPKFVEVLCYLAEQYPRIIPRSELIDAVWAGNSYVGEKALTNAIWHLRQSLKDDNNEVIETIRKVGYRLLIEPIWLDKVVLKSQRPDSTQATPLVKFSQTLQRKYAAVFLACAIALVAFYVNKNNKGHYHGAPTVTQITKSPGSELFASPSPDGRYIVYSWSDNNGAANLYMKDTLQPELPAKQLTFDSDKEGLSAWGKKGEYLYFARKGRGKCDIIKMHVTSQQEQVLATCSRKGGYYYLDVSADNKILAFHGFEAPADTPGIYFIELDNPAAKAVRFSCSNNCGYSDRDMAFSPDGKSIAVSRRKNRFSENIFLVDLKTKNARALTENEEDIVGLTWHPDGKKLVYAAQRSDVRDGYIVDTSSLHVDKLGLVGFSYPAIAKASGQLYYQQRKEQYYIASLTLNSDTTTSPFPVIQSEFNHLYPDYSRAANKMAYVSNESGNYELWVANSDGSERKKLTHLQQTIRYPKWSFDGKKIAFLAPTASGDGDRIYIFDLISNTLKDVPSPFKKHNLPTWSFDDSAIISAIYTQEFTDLFKIDINTGLAQRLTYDGGRYGLMIAEDTLLYTNLKAGLWQRQLDLPASSKPIIKIAAELFDTRYTWSYYDNKVYFGQKQSHHLQVASYDVIAQQLTPIVRLPLKAFDDSSALSLVAEQNTLLFTHALSPQSDIKMLTHPLLDQP
ncbi:component of the Tol biopolymer transport system [Colwellia chukchiensis]|uniref:Component of the Tol biopolymer transport system n=1 Tax=Colwellia chukchiensis TaxID=641665 RepID=A0A1H7IPS3_9GAMM|nr:winged helix-turn-helix domain-containing protein [Colwellia chukchiensis]SEK64503.1 component of the Tol biopolymer transport system [Colwellia chukchiensis]